MSRESKLVVLACVVLGVPATPTAQEVLTESGALTGEYEDHYFGVSLHVHGDRLLIGATGDDEVAHDSGALFLYRREGGAWVEEQKLTPPPYAWDDAYGSSVGSSGDTIIVGAPWNLVGGVQTYGTGFVYDRIDGEWVLTAELENAVVPSEQTQVGRNLAFSGDTVVFGDEFLKGILQGAGAIYVFERTEGVWSGATRLYASDQEQGHFGAALAIEGDTMLVGADFDSGAATKAGSVYVLERQESGWVETAEVFPNDPQDQMRFGASISFDRGRMLVGAPLTDRGDVEDAGAAYLFGTDGTNWRQEAKLVPSNGHTEGQFGWSVHLDGRRALVSSHAKFLNFEGFGHVFERIGDEWVEVARLEVAGGSHWMSFGSEVRLAAGQALVTATQFDDGAGSVFLFEPAGGTQSWPGLPAPVWAPVGGLPTALPDPRRWAW